MSQGPYEELRGPGWLLDEVPSAGRENLDPTHVGRYDDKEDAGAAQEVEMLVGLGLTHDSVVMDLGAGTGQFTVAVAPHCARVIAVDVSSVMLDRLRAKPRRPALTTSMCGRPGSSPTSTSGRRPTSSTRALLCTTCPTPGRPSR
ncbi:MAG: class SAM-dependent methyltransferase [Conexibacter sp.]|nr:class SAM-dependent methyltransferase [Conexibacter sp.]